MAVLPKDIYIGYVAIADDDKRFVILHVDTQEYYFLLINSRMTNYQLRNSRIGALQLPLAHKGREKYLKWNSFLGCEHVQIGKLKDLEREIRAGKIRKLATMDKTDFELARRTIWNSGVYDQMQMEEFGLYEEDFE